MIDTLGVEYWVDIPQSELDEGWLLRYEQRSRGYSNRYTRTGSLLNGAKIRATYIPHSFKEGAPLLLIEMSLPRVVNGSNVYPVYDIPEAVELANRMLMQLKWLRRVNLWEGELTRLDLCWNHQVGDSRVNDYIRSLQTLKYPRRKTKPYSDQGVRFSSKQVSTSFYNKYLECHEPDAQGILRQETTYKKKAINKVTHKDHSLLSDVTCEMILAALKGDLVDLKLFDKEIGTYNTALIQIRSMDQGMKGLGLYGLLLLMEIYPSREELSEVTGLSSSTISRNIKVLENAGLSPTISITQPLPHLIIPDVLDPQEYRTNERKYQVILPEPDHANLNPNDNQSSQISLP